MRWPWNRAADRAERNAAAQVDALETRARSSYDELRAHVVEGFDTLNGDMGTLAERLDDLTPLPRPRVMLDVEEKGRMQMAWPTSRCVWCGTAHGGLCPRVRHITFDNRGAPSSVWFWPEGQWEIPADALTVEDVFGSNVALPQRQEEQT
jgi:hypothetical protein